MLKEIKYNLIEIESVENVGYFENEYVYDIEVNESDYSDQTFFANDILVHNSNYVNFGRVAMCCEYDYSPLEFLFKLNEYRLNDYLKKCFDIYAKKWNTENFQDFELESISRNGIFLGKKKYVLNLAWESPGTDQIEDLSRIKPTGVELAQGGTPPFVRTNLSMLLKHIFSRGKAFDLREFVKLLKDVKTQFKVQSPDAISIGTSVNNIEKFILNDSTNFEFGKGCPMHVRAAGYHNYLLNNSKYKTKYSLIRSGEKIKFYFVATKSEAENNVFGYLNGSYPYEIAPPINYDEQFNRTILDPVNRFIEAMGYPPLSPNLLLVRALF